MCILSNRWYFIFFFFSSRRRHTRLQGDWSSDECSSDLARGGQPPYLLPAGGSSAVGALGYVEAALEIAAQVEAGALPEPAHAVVAVGTGGTAAGLALGFQLAGLRTRVVGIVVNDQLRLGPPVLARLARRS